MEFALILTPCELFNLLAFAVNFMKISGLWAEKYMFALGGLGHLLENKINVLDAIGCLIG